MVRRKEMIDLETFLDIMSDQTDQSAEEIADEVYSSYVWGDTRTMRVTNPPMTYDQICEYVHRRRNDG